MRDDEEPLNVAKWPHRPREPHIPPAVRLGQQYGFAIDCQQIALLVCSNLLLAKQPLPYGKLIFGKRLKS